MTALNVFAAVAKTGEFYTGSVCVDCMFYLANGDAENTDERWDQAKLFATMRQFDIMFGHHHRDNKWDTDRCHHFGSNCEADCRCEEWDFSSTRCFGCDTTVSGGRLDVLAVDQGLVHTRMTMEQFEKLESLCARYGVMMNIGDYLVNAPNSSMMPGWAEGWVGGPTQAGKTIYVGVSPEGDSHS